MNTHHRINYIEFQASDLEEIKAFYTTLFNWTFTDYGPEYVAFTDGTLDGGFARGEEKGAGAPLVILYSKDLEQTQSAIEESHGSVTKPIYAFPGGRRFHFVDPAGNELAVWSDQ